MKTKFLILSLSVFIGCAGGKPSLRSVIALGFDFSKYTKDGFLITPEPYAGDYESMGMIKVYVTPEVRKKSAQHYDPTKWQWDITMKGQWLIERLDPIIVIDESYKLAKSMNADAITRFAIQQVYINLNGLTVPTYEVTGFAIVRRALPVKIQN